jgi:hypothetical protein
MKVDSLLALIAGDNEWSGLSFEWAKNNGGNAGDYEWVKKSIGSLREACGDLKGGRFDTRAISPKYLEWAGASSDDVEDVGRMSNGPSNGGALDRCVTSRED